MNISMESSSPSPSSSPSDPSTVNNSDNPAAAASVSVLKPGVAGRTDYGSWDKITKDLNSNLDAQEAEEIEAAKAALGTEKYSLSKDHADEKAKAGKVLQVKKQLEQYQQRETAVMATFSDVFQPSSSNKDNNNTIRLTRNDMAAGKRVVTLCDSTGDDSSNIVLTQDLSSLESQMPTTTTANPLQKSYPDDAENDVPVVPNKSNSNNSMRSIYGIIKLFLSNLHHCTVHIRCKIITGTVEVHNCSNLTIVVHSTATVATLQADLSQHLNVQFRNAPSGKNPAPIVNNSDLPKNFMYWGQDKDDRIFHAGVSDMKVQIYRDDMLETSIVSDYLKDGATTVGNATPEEMQFVTSCSNGKNDNGKFELTTERVVRQGSSTGSNVRAMTQRELDAEQLRRDKAVKMAVAMAEDMIQIKDKNGNLVTKTETAANANDDVTEEVISPSVKAIVAECEQNKARGNEAFGAGEYGQAILLYSLALDKAAELAAELAGDVANDDDNNNISTRAAQSLFPRDVVLSNRAACFLKLGQHEKAVEDANCALQINPDNLKATFRQGLGLHAMGHYTQALPILARAHKQEPHNKQIKQALQFCEVRAQQEHHKRMQG